MRPHTRTQCADGKECPECRSHNNSANHDFLDPPHQHSSSAGQLGAGSSGVLSSGSANGGAAGGGGPGAAEGCPFVAPSSGRLRRSVTNAAKAAAAAAASHHKVAWEGGIRSILIVELPAEVLVKILNYMPFKEVSQVRLVSRRFNEICASMLNSTFQRLQSHMLSRFQSIKGQMPRRESARRNHPLARECDIVETLHMRLTLLQMTFGKHIERKHVCFFAGEILDEVHRILRYVRQTPSLVNVKAYKITDELFDLSTMAMEYFKEHIEPTLPEITYFGTEFLDFAAPFAAPTKRRSQSGAAGLFGPCFDSASACSSRASVAGSSSSEHWSVSSNVGNPDDAGFQGDDALPPPPQPSNMVLRKRIRRIRQGMKRYNDQLVEVKRDLKSCKSKMESQAKQVHEYSSRLEEYDKKFEESSRKFQTLLTELNKCKTELQYWRSKSTTLLSLPPTCSHCDAPLISQNVVANEFTEGGANSAAVGYETAVKELKALANQGVFPTLPSCPVDAGLCDGVDAETAGANLLEGDNEVQIKQVSSGPPAAAVVGVAAAGGPRAVAKNAGPPSPGLGGRKRRSRDDADGGGEADPGGAAGTRKSLRGGGVKGTRAAKRPKLSVANNQ